MSELASVSSPSNEGEETSFDALDGTEDEETQSEVVSEMQSDQDAFQERVDRLVGMIGDDPSIRDRMIAETYVTIAEFSETLREMQAAMGSMGPAGFMRAMMSGGGGG